MLRQALSDLWEGGRKNQQTPSEHGENIQMSFSSLQEHTERPESVSPVVSKKHIRSEKQYLTKSGI